MCDNIINEVVKESTAQVVRSSLDEVVVSHMAVIKSGDWLEDFIVETIQPMLPRVVREFLCAVYASELTMAIFRGCVPLHTFIILAVRK